MTLSTYPWASVTTTSDNTGDALRLSGRDAQRRRLKVQRDGLVCRPRSILQDADLELTVHLRTGFLEILLALFLKFLAQLRTPDAEQVVGCLLDGAGVATHLEGDRLA